MIGNQIAGFFSVGTPPVPPSNFESIATVTVGSGGTSTITFSSIPSTYKHLQIRAFGKAVNSSVYNCYINFNSDTASNYSLHRLYGYGSGVAYNEYFSTAMETNYLYGGSTGMWNVVVDVLEYKNTNIYKTIKTLGGYDANGSGEVGLISGNWRSTSAVNSISFTNNGGGFAQYSSFALYGITGA